MAELEKVIKGLEICTSGNVESGLKCTDCPYYEDCKFNPIKQMMKDALSLLKAQEPMLLENQHKPYGHVVNVNSPWISRCPRCGKKVEGKQTRFCKYCGQAVKWDGFDRKTLV